MNELKAYIEILLETPTQENITHFFQLLKDEEIRLLELAENEPPKTTEYFKKRQNAFNLRRDIAMYLIPLWISKFGTTVDCPLKFQDTLNIPFRTLSK